MKKPTTVAALDKLGRVRITIRSAYRSAEVNALGNAMQKAGQAHP